MENDKNDDLNMKFKDVTKNKIIISSYHASKGCERDLVIIFNFDNSYFDYFGK